MSRFTLEPGRWYACQLIGEEFRDDDGYAFTAIRIDRIEALKTGKGMVRLWFYHANYPEGVRDKEYTLQTVERGERFLLAVTTDHQPRRFLLINEIDAGWIERHVGRRVESSDVQAWLDRNA